MNYLSELLEIQEAVENGRIDGPRYAAYLDKDERVEKDKRLQEARKAIANSILSKEDKDMFSDIVEGYKANMQTANADKSSKGSESWKYLLVALLSGGVGFGLGWYAKNAYDDHKDSRVNEIIEIVKREMDK